VLAETPHDYVLMSVNLTFSMGSEYSFQSIIAVILATLGIKRDTDIS
jgi:hypothetical protein